MIDVRGLQKSYGGRVVLDISALHVSCGERVALLGPNGSGKSTLLRLLAGSVAPDKGTLAVEGARGYMPQSPYAFDCSVKSNVLLALGRSPGAEDMAMRALALVGLTHLAGARGNRLSGGEQQRMALARTLAGSHALLLLDEPTAGVDMAAVDAIEEALTDYMERNRTTLLLSSHAPAQAKRLCTRVLVLDHGRIVEDGPPERVLSAPQSPEAAAFLRHWRF